MTLCCFVFFIMQPLPQSLLDSAELAQITLEYKKECRQEDSVESLAQLCTPPEDCTSQYLRDQRHRLLGIPLLTEGAKGPSLRGGADDVAKVELVTVSGQR